MYDSSRYKYIWIIVLQKYNYLQLEKPLYSGCINIINWEISDQLFLQQSLPFLSLIAVIGN